MNLSLTAAQRELCQKIDAAPGSGLPVEEIGTNRRDGYNTLRTLTASDLVVVTRPSRKDAGVAMLTTRGANTLAADLRTIAAKIAASEAPAIAPTMTGVSDALIARLMGCYETALAFAAEAPDDRLRRGRVEGILAAVRALGLPLPSADDREADMADAIERAEAAEDATCPLHEDCTAPRMSVHYCPHPDVNATGTRVVNGEHAEHDSADELQPIAEAVNEGIDAYVAKRFDR
jgi:hypothetical protein